MNKNLIICLFIPIIIITDIIIDLLVIDYLFDQTNLQSFYDFAKFLVLLFLFYEIFWIKYK
jgi:hypothetical protein